jgi:hypothetical protein
VDCASIHLLNKPTAATSASLPPATSSIQPLQPTGTTSTDTPAPGVIDTRISPVHLIHSYFPHLQTIILINPSVLHFLNLSLYSCFLYCSCARLQHHPQLVTYQKHLNLPGLFPCTLHISAYQVCSHPHIYQLSFVLVAKFISS